MENLVGKISASLIEKDEPLPIGLLDKINQNIKPPNPIASDDIHIRAMYIISDQVNSYGGCFPPDEHPGLIELLIDSPVIVGHRKDTLPIARNFHAEAVIRNDVNWIKVYFYWLKNAEKGEDLRKNIDGGIYKECSISFTFSFPECSICGSDIRECRHRPFVEYDTDSGRRQAYFNYRQIDKVLETSLVYRGSVADTSITRELAFSKTAANEGIISLDTADSLPVQRIWDFGSLSPEKKYLVMPAYESLPILLVKSGKSTKMISSDRKIIEDRSLKEYLDNLVLASGDYVLDCRLLGYRGKERQSPEAIVKYLTGQKSSVRRLEVKVYDLIALDNKDCTRMDGGARRNLLQQYFRDSDELLVRASEVQGKDIPSMLKSLATRYGFEALAVDSSEKIHCTFRRLVPCRVTGHENSGGQYRYHLSSRLGDCMIPLKEPVVSVAKLSEGDSVEIEVHSLYKIDDHIEAIQPRIAESLGNWGGAAADISSLLSNAQERPDLGDYYIASMTRGDLSLAFIRGGKRQKGFLICHYSPQLLASGRRFLADEISPEYDMTEGSGGQGRIINEVRSGSTMIYALEGELSGRLVFQPARLNGRERWLFYRLQESSIAGS